MCNCIKFQILKTDELKKGDVTNNHFICFIKDAKLILIYDNQLFKFRWISYCDGTVDEKVLSLIENHHFEDKETALLYVSNFFNCKKIIGLDLMQLSDKLF